MENWYSTGSFSDVKPEDTDLTSSKVYNYARKDFKRVEYDPQPYNEEPHGMAYRWDWMEQKIRKEDWNEYLLISGDINSLKMTDSGVMDMANIIDEQRITIDAMQAEIDELKAKLNNITNNA